MYTALTRYVSKKQREVGLFCLPLSPLSVHNFRNFLIRLTNYTVFGQTPAFIKLQATSAGLGMKIAYICIMYFTSSVCIVTRRDVQFSDIMVLSQSGVNVLFIRPSDVTNNEHKLRQFSNSLTFYFRILGYKGIFIIYNVLDLFRYLT